MSTLLMSVYCYFKNLVNEEDGQDLIEYALIIALFVIVAAVAVTALIDPLEALWADIAGNLAAGA
jgi:Flp pilus assembly pilin Flp